MDGGGGGGAGIVDEGVELAGVGGADSTGARLGGDVAVGVGAARLRPGGLEEVADGGAVFAPGQQAQAAGEGPSRVTVGVEAQQVSGDVLGAWAVAPVGLALRHGGVDRRDELVVAA